MNIPVTEWFPAEVKPSLIGEYDYLYPHKYLFRAFWDGSKFTVRDQKFPMCWNQEIPSKSGDKWRGLTSPHPEWKP